ncbi:MAG: isochorismatase family protein [Patescibacteria group bacterium]
MKQTGKFSDAVRVGGVVILKSRTASLDVDPEKCFTELCPLELPVPGALEIVPELDKNAKLGKVRLASKDAHSRKAVWVATAEEPQLSPIIGYPNMDVRWNGHGVPGELGFEFLPGLKRENYNFIAYKGIELDMHPYGACFHDLADTQSTGLIEYLLVNKIKNVIVGGLATSYCVKITVLQLCRSKHFQVIVNLASCRDITGAPTEESIAEMRAAGAIVIDNLESNPQATITDFGTRRSFSGRMVSLQESYRNLLHLKQ